VLGVLQPIWGRIPETASRLRGRIEAVLDYGKANGLRSGENPAAWRGHLALILPKRGKLTRGHHAAMPYHDIPEFIAKLQELRHDVEKWIDPSMRTRPRLRILRISSGRKKKNIWIKY